MRTLLLATVTLLLFGCDRGRETRTFALRYLDATNASQMIGPYVPNAETNMRATTDPPSLTITAPEVRLEQIAQVLGTHDQPRPDVRLRFQLIEADGFTTAEPAIADVEQALRELFRFTGYRLVGESVVQAKAWSSVSSQLGSGEAEYGIGAEVQRVVSASNGNAVELAVYLEGQGGPLLRTSLTVPSGQTVVVGSARAQANGNTLILVVRPLIE